MLRSDGTVAVVVVLLLLPPQADTIRPRRATAGRNRANFLRIPHKSKFLPPSFRCCSGREGAGGKTFSDATGEHFARPKDFLVFGCLARLPASSLLKLR